MKYRVMAAFFLTLFSAFAVSSLASQALEGRTASNQLNNVRQQVLGGRLPAADVWPQASLPTEDSPVNIDTEMYFNLGGGLRTTESSFWDSLQFRRPEDNDLFRWIAYAEEKGHWGAYFRADFYADGAGWHNTSLFLPQEGNIFPLESHFIKQSWLWYDFHPLQIEVGRDKIHWGPLDHSLIVGDQIPFLDMVRGQLAMGPFSLDWVISTPETRTTGGQSDVTDFQLLNLHRLSYRTDTWRLSLSERYIVHRESGPYVMADFFPVGVFHQNDINPNNNCFYIDGEWVPVPGWRLMAQYGIDDVDGNMFGVPDYEIPTIWGFLAGAEWQGDWNGDPLRLYAEVGGTHYLWGDFSDAKATAVYRLVQDERTDTMDLSSPYGPGTYWFNVSARWTKSRLSVTALLEVFDTKDGVSDLVPGEEDYTYHNTLEGFGSQPSGRLSLDIKYQLSRRFTIVFQPAETYHRGAWATEARASLECTL